MYRFARDVGESRFLTGFNWHDFNDGSLEVSRAPNV